MAPSPNGYNLRMPPELRVALAAAAQANRRTLHAEIIWRLVKSLEGYRQL